MDPVTPLPDAVEALLARHGGLARRRDLVRAGLTRRGLERRVRDGSLRALTPHLYTDLDTPRPDEQLRRDAVGLDAVVSHTSAALLWDLELVQTPTGRCLTVPRSRTRVRAGGVRVHRRDLPAGGVVLRDGLRVTSVPQTVLDLCRSLPVAHAVAVADSALRRRLLTVEDLRQAYAALPAAPGRAAVGRVLELVDPASGSVLESLTRVLLAQHGLRPPQSQLVVVSPLTGRVIGRVDFGWPDRRLVVETDGFAFHRSRQDYRQDRRRSTALAVAGWTVLRFSWEDVVAFPRYVVDSVREALALLEQQDAAA